MVRKQKIIDLIVNIILDYFKKTVHNVKFYGKPLKLLNKIPKK